MLRRKEAAHEDAYARYAARNSDMSVTLIEMRRR